MTKPLYAAVIEPVTDASRTNLGTSQLVAADQYKPGDEVRDVGEAGEAAQIAMCPRSMTRSNMLGAHRQLVST